MQEDRVCFVMFCAGKSDEKICALSYRVTDGEIRDFASDSSDEVYQYLSVTRVAKCGTDPDGTPVLRRYAGYDYSCISRRSTMVLRPNRAPASHGSYAFRAASNRIIFARFGIRDRAAREITHPADA